MFVLQISVFNTVSALRAERPHMIQTFHQYVFLYDAVFEHQHAGNTVMGDNFRECYQMLVKRNPVTGRSYLRDQFLLLRLVSTHDLQSKDGRNVPDLIPPVRAINRTGNRVDIDIEELEELEEGPVGNLGSRRNAFFVDSYRRRHHYVLSPTPTPYEVCDFWQLVYDNNITAIIMLDEDVTVVSRDVIVVSRTLKVVWWCREAVTVCKVYKNSLVGKVQTYLDSLAYTSCTFGVGPLGLKFMFHDSLIFLFVSVFDEQSKAARAVLAQVRVTAMGAIYSGTGGQQLAKRNPDPHFDLGP